MVTTLYLIRHCRSVGNGGNRYQGRFDSPVSPEGAQQMDLLALRFRNRPLDAVYTSPLTRAYKTAEAVNRFHGLPIQVMDDLIEMDGGEVENMTLSDLGRAYPEVLHNWFYEPERCAFPGGESMEQVYARVNAAIDEIVAANPGGHVAVTTHGGVLINIYARVRHGKLEGVRDSVHFDNTGVTTLVAENGVLRFEKLNDIDHIPESLRRPSTPIPDPEETP